MSAKAQFVDCTTGLLIAPSADMNESGTFMITNNFLNEHYTPTLAGEFPFDYNTFGYGFNITFWSRLEVAYICTLFNGKWSPRAQTPQGTYREKIIKNQDRHFAAKLLLLKEGEIWKWTPSIAIGISDPVTSAGGNYIEGGQGISSGNGFYNRYYAVATKHFDTPWGVVGGTIGYQYNRRTDYPLNAPCAAVTWNPKWLNVEGSFLSSFRVIAEFDSRTFNVGLTTSIWKDHFEAMLALNNMQWFSAGLRFKVVLKGSE